MFNDVAFAIYLGVSILLLLVFLVLSIRTVGSRKRIEKAVDCLAENQKSIHADVEDLEARLKARAG